MKNAALFITITLSVTLMMFGCQTSQGSKYSSGQANTPMTVYYGTVLRVSQVTIEKPSTPVGAIVGGVAGGVIGSTVGQGRGRRLSTTAGALGGAALGSAAEKSANQIPGLEIEVEMDDGRIMAVVQPKDDDFAVGDRIRLLRGQDGSYRVRQ